MGAEESGNKGGMGGSMLRLRPVAPCAVHVPVPAVVWPLVLPLPNGGSCRCWAGCVGSPQQEE